MSGKKSFSLTNLFAVFSENKKYIFYKFFPSSMMLLLSAYIHNFLRGVKDAVLVPSLGPELISFIKFYGVFPATLIFFIIFTRLANVLDRDKLYYAIITFFASFLMLYAFVLSPYQNYIQPDFSQEMLAYPKFKYHFMMMQHWTTSLFYVMCELCGTVVLAFLFWQFANELYTLKEAKKTYALLGAVGKVGIVIAGLSQVTISEYIAKHAVASEAWELTLKWMMSSVMIAGLGLIFLYRWIYSNVFFNQDLCARNHAGKREEITLSVGESLKYLCSSKYLWLIMMLVFSYGVTINLVESAWKYQLKQVYITNSSYSAFMGKFTMYFGFCSITTMFIGAYVLNKFKWLLGALLTPTGAGVTGVIFFLVVIYQDAFQPLAEYFNSTVMMMSVMIGSVQIIFFKCLNYTFDVSTREMAFMPLDRELRTKGKAAVDVIGNRGGKSFGALAQQFMFQFISPSVGDLTAELFGFFVVMIAIWIASVIALSSKFYKIADQANH